MTSMSVRGAIAITAISAIAAFSGSSAQASSAGAICAYKSGSMDITVAIAGSDNRESFCRSFNSGFHGVRFYGGGAGAIMCAWGMANRNIVLAVLSHDKSVGKLFCGMLAPKIGASWTRVR